MRNTCVMLGMSFFPSCNQRVGFDQFFLVIGERQRIVQRLALVAPDHGTGFKRGPVGREIGNREFRLVGSHLARFVFTRQKLQCIFPGGSVKPVSYAMAVTAELGGGLLAQFDLDAVAHHADQLVCSSRTWPMKSNSVCALPLLLASAISAPGILTENGTK